MCVKGMGGDLQTTDGVLSGEQWPTCLMESTGRDCGDREEVKSFLFFFNLRQLLAFMKRKSEPVNR